MLIISQVARRLNISKKTIMRWDEGDKKSPAKRDPNTNIRLYEERDIEQIEIWFELRRRHKKNLRLLPDILKETRKFVRTVPLFKNTNPPASNYESMKKAYKQMDEWREKEEEIAKGYDLIPIGFKYRHLDPFS